MALIILIFPVTLIIGLISAWFIARAAFKKLKNQNSEYPGALSALIFIFSLIIIGGGIFFLIATNVELGR